MNWTSWCVLFMHVYFCPEQQQTLSYQKDVEISWPFASVSNLYQSCKNLPGLLYACWKWLTVDFEKVWEQCYMWYLAANSSATHSLSSLIPMHTMPSFLSLIIQQATESEVAAWEKATQSTLWKLSKKSCTHRRSTRYEWETLSAQPSASSKQLTTPTVRQ